MKQKSACFEADMKAIWPKSWIIRRLGPFGSKQPPNCALNVSEKQAEPLVPTRKIPAVCLFYLPLTMITFLHIFVEDRAELERY
jgi:hypothetical protein